MTGVSPVQLGPENKIQFGPFSYAKAIIKDDVTYPIVPNCPTINADENGKFDYQNIPAGTFFIVHISYYDTPGDGGWWEELYLRVADEANDSANEGLVSFAERGYDPDGVK